MSEEVLRELLAANREFASGRASVADAHPRRHLAVVTCMDARIDVFAALGLELGDAHVIRNAGGRVTNDVLRSLTLSTHVLGTDTVVLMQHTNCGLTGVSDDGLRQRTGVDLDFKAIDDHQTALEEDVEAIASKEYLASIETIAGFVYDVRTGEVEELLRRNRTAQY